MASETPASRETQEQSIKARKHELFQPEAAPAASAAPRKTIKQYLRDTRPVPMAPTVKVALWVAGVLVVLLFVASLVSIALRPPRRPQRPRSSAAPVSPAQLAAALMTETGGFF
jgi:hypothetical protein